MNDLLPNLDEIIAYATEGMQSIYVLHFCQLSNHKFDLY